MSNHQEISSFIWNVCDDVLRGLFKQHEYGDVILPFVILRRLDCVIEPQKDKVIELYKELKDEVDPTPIIRKQTKLKFFNHSNFDLQRLKGDPNGLKVNFPNYINGYSQNVFEILENFQLEKPVEKLLKNNKLYLLIDKFTEVDLHPEVVDNHTMGQIFEELLRKFSEMSNETSGEHYTPRDVVKLLVSLVFSGEEDQLSGEGIIRSIFDPCCGTGGMLSIGKEWIENHVSSKVRVNLYGQELNPQTFSICKSDMLITGEDPDNIKLGSSLSMDQFEGREFDYMITNPPFGVSWKGEKDFILQESENPLGRFSHGLPWIKDGQLLFMSHMISKMKKEGSRLGIITNGSPLTTGDGKRGESQFRKWLLDEDLVESIVLLPDDLFFNTGILSYIWILNNKKQEARKGKVQLINGLNSYSELFKPIGDKRKSIDFSDRKKLLDEYVKFEESEFSRIFDNDHFKYRLVKIYHPMRDADGVTIVDTKGNLKKDPNMTDVVKVPYSEPVEVFFKKYSANNPDSWYEHKEIVEGGEFHITKYFFKPKKVKSIPNIKEKVLEYQSQLNKLGEIDFGGASKTPSLSLDWFGPIPEDWEIMTIGDCFIERRQKVSDKDYQPLSVTKNGVVMQLDHVSKSSDSDNRKLVLEGDFVINSRSDRRGSSGLSRYNGSVSLINIVITPRGFLLPEYVHYLLRSINFQEEFYRNGKGIVDDLWTTDYSEMRKISIPIPPIDHQRSMIKKMENLNLIIDYNKKILELYENLEESFCSLT